MLSSKTRNYTTVGGVELTIHTVPTNVINGIVPKTPKPKKPVVEMKTVAGKQPRPAKEGDPEWTAYQAELAEWEEERESLREAASTVLALRSFEIKGKPITKVNPDDLVFPDYLYDMADIGAFDWPEHDLELKALWLSTEILTQQDELEIGWILQELSGVPEDLIEQYKESFRNSLYGKINSATGEGTVEDEGL